MSRSSKGLWKRATALLLAAMLVVPELAAVSTAEAEERSTIGNALSNAVLNAVYGTVGQPPAGGTSPGPSGKGPSGVAVPFAAAVTGGEAPTWNLLTKLGRDFISTIYQPDEQELKMSSDGRYIAYKRLEMRMEAGMPTIIPAVAVYDRVTGEMDLIRINGANAAQQDEILHFDMSGDARYVAFTYATGLMDRQTHVYLFDRHPEHRKLTAITAGKPGVTDYGDGNRVSISADGRYVAFDSDANGLVPGDDDDYYDVFVYNRDDGSIVRISTRAGMEDYDYGDSKAPSLSSDGRYIVFQSDARLVENDTEGRSDIYLLDRQGGGAPFRLVSVGLNGAEANGQSGLPSISADGQVIAFVSDADNMIENDFNEKRDIFVFNRLQSTLVRVSNLPGGLPFTRDSAEPSISDDGRYVGFHLDSWDEDVPKEAFVADVAAQTAYRVTVPNAPYRLFNPSQSPIVGRGGSLVVYGSEYEETLGGMANDYIIPGLFIAAQGNAPVWPAGSKLAATDKTEVSVKLSWPDASDPAGVLGYHVYKDGANIGYVPFSGSGGNTLTATGLLPGAEHVFQVEAVNADYHESYGGPTYKLGTGGGENPGGELRIMWEFDGERNGVVLPGSKLSATAYGEKGKQVAAELSYAAWKDDTSQETRKVQLQFAERAASPGVYDASWTMPEAISRIVSMNVTLTDPVQPGAVLAKAADGLPIQVAGTAVITFQNENGVSLANSLLSVYSRQYGEQVSILTGNDSFTVNGLFPGKDYTFQLRSPDYRHTWGMVEQVQVEAGRSKAVSMNIEPPANIRFQIVGPTGQPVDGVRVELFDSQQNFINSYYNGTDGWTPWEQNLEGGKTIVVKVDIGDKLIKPVPNQEVVLKPGSNEKVIRLEVPGEGVLQGYVKAPNGQPVRNALVTSTQTYRGQPIVRKTRTNLEGAYRLQLLAGEAAIEAYESSYQYSTDGVVQAYVAEGQSTAMDIPVRQPSRGVVNLEVRLKYIEDTEFGDPINMDLMGLYTRVETRTGWQTGYFSNAYHIGGAPGDKVSVCVTGTVPAYMTTCTDAILDENANATAKLYLEEKGARIQGKLAQTSYKWMSGSIYKLKQDGYRSSSSRYVGMDDFAADGAFNINVPEAGTFVLELVGQLAGSPAKYEYANVQFTVADKQILQIGSVSFSEKTMFSNYYGNYFDAIDSRVVPGGTITFRAGYKNAGNSEASDAKLLIDIPEGTTVVKDARGRVILGGTGAIGEPELDGQTLIVPIGAIAVKQSGTVSFQVKIDPLFNNSSLKSSARIHAVAGGKQIEETIGNVLLDAPLVTLEVPDQVFHSSVQLSGVAPVQSIVKVYDGNELLGSAAASVTGFWSVRVELPDIGDPGTHALRAETEANGVKLQSPVSYVIYDTKKPRLLEMAMAQAPEGKWVTLNVRDGIPAVPYTVIPGNPFQFELLFDKPDKVENAYVYLDGQLGEPVKAVRDGGVFRAFTPTDKGALGDIYVDFDTIPEPVTVNGKQPSMDEIKASLPLDMRDFEAEVTSPFELKDGKYSGTVKLTFPQLEDMTMTVKLTLTPDTSYSATSEERAQVERSGVPMYNGSFELTETDDGFKTVSSGYIPMSVLFPEGLPAELKAVRAAKGVHALDADPAFAAVVTESYVQFGPNGSEFGTFNSIKSQYDGMQSFAGRINRITYRVQSSGLDCLAELPGTIKQAGKALAATVGGEVAKFGLGVWTGMMGLSGAGAIAAAGTSAVVGAKIDNYVDSQIDSIGTGYNQCRNDDEETKKRKKYKKVRGRWIYDPSGHVYEAVPENRLSGVKATVLYQDPVSKEWTVWDAAPYEQVNPHNTDDQGKYGWDVPEGKWKVVWEKAGYETQSSAELDVPPPHTEVHAGLVSREPPKIRTVTGVTYAGGSYVDIELSKYVQVTNPTVVSQALTITGANGGTLEGTADFVGAANNPADPGGAKLSRIVRFTPKTAVPVGDGYRAKVKGGYLQSYSGVWMNEEQTAAFAFAARDERGPEAVSASVEAEGMIVRLTFDEKVGSNVDMSKITMNGSGELLVSAVKTADVDDGRSVLLTFMEPPLAPGAVGQLAIMAGAVSDAAGNGSVQKTLPVARTGSSNNALLASLQVAEGELAPAFDPAKQAYTLAVPQAAEHVQITAATAAPKAKLVIEGIETASGKPTSVPIPGSGDIAIRVTAEDGVTVREYTIRVTRREGPDDGNSPAPGGGSTSGGPVDPALTKLEPFTGKNGGSGLRVTLQSGAIAKAIQTGSDGNKQLLVEVKEQADEYALQLSAEVRAELRQRGAEVIFKTVAWQAAIPVEVLEHAVLPAGASLQLAVGTASTSEENAAAEAAARQSGNALKLSGHVLNIWLETVSGNQASPVSFKSAKPIRMRIATDGTGQQAVYRFDGADSGWAFVWGQKSEANGGGTVIEIVSSGSYAVMAYANRFSDIAGHWAEADIGWMGRRLLVNGAAPDAFKPDLPVTRAEFAAMLVRALGLRSVSNSSIYRFEDVGAGAWYYASVGAAAEAGLIDGVASDRFEPDALITREQMAVMIWRAYEYIDAAKRKDAKPQQLERFADRAGISGWAAGAVALAAEAGFIQGTDSAAFDPQGRATRAQAATIMKRLLQATKN
ncbi:hypothetical protein FE784_37205 [Paenibacillus hemerocallicola]|uniref:Fibronectin type-III domain-containing protein n=1 Tax=Paenibacillus hemerocallicola TaxID=1172614 RepID=A0A5C4SX60_9BACL|nr:S-layer homology domain-containing protein [Paenibacillus hemerocallicola]TNJ59520.1 hypothetical protein FE784_37205 [Paenibacillus hemerocallicola]